jgi:hypothetical protein
MILAVITIAMQYVTYAPAVQGADFYLNTERALELGHLESDVYLAGFVFRTLQVTGLGTCIKECVTRTKCQSLNYSKRNLVCELSGTTATSQPANVSAQPGYMYSEKAVWPQVSSTIRIKSIFV